MPNCASTTERRRAWPGVRLATALLLAGGIHVACGHAADGMPGMARAARSQLGASAAFAPDGRLLAVARQGGHVLLHRSDDAGRSWRPPQVVNAEAEAIAADGEDRPRLAFAADGAVLVSWTRPLGKPYSGQIRLARAADGEHFDLPITVHRDPAEITHRFGALHAAPDGSVVVAWIDKRDLEAAKAAKRKYRGAALYAAVSRDGGKSFAPERKIADHSCECCRLAIAVDTDGAPLLLWRHVFAPNERDHALARLTADGRPEKVVRATFERWQIDGCPHHGPALAVAPDGTRHAVWFNQKDGEGRVFYGRLPTGDGGKIEGQRPVGGPRAEHADLAVAGSHLALVWKEFDGQQMRLRAEVSQDGGRTFRPLELATTAGASDQPRALRRGDALFAFWHTEGEGMRVFPLE